jgi:Spx/MgsR family transcriptional regulator
MKKWKIYEYGGCSTCRKALKFLDSRKVPYEKIDITSQAPSREELKKMASILGDEKPLFNTSGQVYRELGLSKKLPGMSQAEQLALLASNGRLVKRPFLLGDGWGFVGFREDEWKKRFPAK